MLPSPRSQELRSGIAGLSRAQRDLDAAVKRGGPAGRDVTELRRSVDDLRRAGAVRSGSKWISRPGSS